MWEHKGCDGCKHKHMQGFPHNSLKVRLMNIPPPYKLLDLLPYWSGRDWRDGRSPKTHGNILQLPKCTVTQANIGAHTGAETAACYAYWLQPPFFQRGCQAWSSYVSHVRLHGEGLPRPPFPVEGSMIAYELHNPTHIPSPFMHEPIHITI